MMATTQSQIEPEGPLLVIGVGLGRTGTNSLKKALELLYGRPCYHMFEALDNHQEHMRIWLYLDEHLTEEAEVDADAAARFAQIYKDYRCAVDFPTCAFYKYLMKLYPQAKFILTIRNSESWIGSVRGTILPRKFHMDWADKIIRTAFHGLGVTKIDEMIWRRAFGAEIDLDDDVAMMRAFERWNEDVKHNIPADQLLVFQVKDGWDPLCTFLNLPKPSCPFPNVNNRAEIGDRLKRTAMITQTFRWSVLLFIGSILAYLMYTFK